MKITGKVEEIESDLHDQLKVSFVLLVSLAMHSFFRYNLQRWQPKYDEVSCVVNRPAFTNDPSGFL